MHSLLGVWREAAARRELASLTDHLDQAGLALGALAPGPLAKVDQHAAAVRDILTLSGAGTLGPIELAGYARGVRDAASESPCETDTEWVGLRLAAVCLLAAAGTVTLTGGDFDPLLFAF